MAFPDDFTGTNGAAWSTTYWNAASVGTATIQSNKGRLQAPGGTYQYGEITSKEGGGLVGVADFDYTLELTPSVWGGSEHALYIKGRKDPSNQDWVGVTLDTSTYDNGGVVSPGSGTITAGRVRLITVTGGVIATTHGTKQITVSTTPAVVYIRFECTGSTVRLKAWRDGESEPGSWDVSATESTYQSNTGWHYGFYSGGQNGNYWDLDPYAAVAAAVTAQVCTFTLSPQAGVITAGPVTVTAQMATFTLSPQTITPTPGAVTVTAQACTFTLSPQAGVITPGAVVVAAQAYTFTLGPQPGTVTTGAITVTAQAATFTLSPQPGVITNITAGPTIVGPYVIAWTEPAATSHREAATSSWTEPALASGGDQ